MNRLRLYAIFHLNLAYSSIEEARRPEVIERCYWPLLRLARSYRLPLGIEATGYTLETIAKLDPFWIKELRALTEEGICEFIGSGYTQLIGPLVPALVNTANQRLGIAVYEDLLGQRPRLALVNEQAWSAGLVRHYLDAGYRAVIMEWNNPARTHPDWNREWRYWPQYARGSDDELIPLLWNHSIAFQKFQRYAHGEIELDEYLSDLRSHITGVDRAFPLYGNDIEVFDFRPGRFMTEAPLHGDGEWQRIETLFAALLHESDMRFIHPSQVLDFLERPNAGHALRLESAAQPVPVKKQDKYNLLRWAATGRADLGVNTDCWRIYAALRINPTTTDADWRELCYLWSSDFRTHITGTRWRIFRERLDAALLRCGLEARSADQSIGEEVEPPRRCAPPLLIQEGENRSSTPLHVEREESGCQVREEGRFLDIESDQLRLRLNLRRGLAIEALTFREVSELPLLGTLPHGYFDDIHWGADFYSGHLVLERPGYPKLTDLAPVRPRWQCHDASIELFAEIATPLGPVEKHINLDLAKGWVRLEYRPRWAGIPKGSMRLGYITLRPEAFTEEQLYFRTNHGGDVETFTLAGQTVDHGQPVSFLVSASHALGMTEGWIELGDTQHVLRVELDRSEAACIGLLTHRQVGDAYFCRLAFSAGEIDDTCRDGLWPVLRYAFTLSARRG